MLKKKKKEDDLGKERERKMDGDVKRRSRKGDCNSKGVPMVPYFSCSR